ncbi:MAG TPA: hypothetical protein VFR24_20295 [Candidatus Angelobacter sp.]|nr:hypothetical protein [Candidatus Angelobacter sp.]
MKTGREIACLLSHKCNVESHKIGSDLQKILASFDVQCEIDPFPPGYDVSFRMQTFEIETVIFLSSTESIDSMFCQQELQAAMRQGLPIFTAYVSGILPTWLKKRVVWHVPLRNDTEFVTGAQILATSIRERVLFHRQVRLLYPENDYFETIEAARNIALEGERTLIAEYACELARRYRHITDPSTLYWIAVALGKANTPQAAKLLDHLPKGNHPLISEGIRQAREFMCD